MRAYYKICIFVIVVCALNTFGYYCTEHNLTFGLNPLWFIIMNVIQTGIAVVSFLMFFPIYCITDDLEKQAFLRDMGLDTYNKLIVLYPFVAMVCVNIQVGSILNSITSMIITVYAFLMVCAHRSFTMQHIKKMAEQGTDNS